MRLNRSPARANNAVRLIQCLFILAMVLKPVDAQSQTDNDYRFWTRADGRKVKIEMLLVEQNSDTVKLKRKDTGAVYTVPKKKLSDNDRRYVAGLQVSSKPETPKSVSARKASTRSGNNKETVTRAVDWPCFRGPQRNGISNGKLDLIDDPIEVWKVDDLGKRLHGSAAIVDGRLYINGGRPADRSEPFLYCLDANTGKEIWKKRSGRTNSTPTIFEGRVYCVGDRQVVRCFDAMSGDPVWKSEKIPSSGERHYGHSGSAIVWDDLLILNYGYGAALNRETGAIVWSFDGLAGLATPVIFSCDENPAVAIFCGDKMIARDVRSGKELWSIPWVTKYGVNACDPLFVDNDSKVFLSSGYGLGRALYDVSGEEPKELWSLGSGSNYSSGVYLDGDIYSMAGGFGRLDLGTGKRLTRGPNAHSVLVVDQKLIFVEKSGGLQIGTIRKGEYKGLVKAKIADGDTWNVPAYWDGKLYVRNGDGVLVCMRIGK